MITLTAPAFASAGDGAAAAQDSLNGSVGISRAPEFAKVVEPSFDMFLPEGAQGFEIFSTTLSL